MISKMIMTAVLATAFAGTAFAAERVLESGKEEVKAAVEYAVVSVEAKCRPPRFEDDSFTPYFTASSYRLIAPYRDQGYAEVLLNKTCGGGGTAEKPELSATKFETVKVLLINVQKAKTSIDSQIGAIIDSFAP